MKCLYACVEKLFGNAGACREGGVKIRRNFLYHPLWMRFLRQFLNRTVFIKDSIRFSNYKVFALKKLLLARFKIEGGVLKCMLPQTNP